MAGHVFVSYSREDRPYVARLTAFLGEHGLPVWTDSDIEAGDAWWPTVVERIRRCAALVVVMTPAAGESPWVRKELFVAIQDDRLILPLLLAGRPLTEVIDLHYEDVSDGRLPHEAFVQRLRRAGVGGPETPRQDHGSLAAGLPEPLRQRLQRGPSRASSSPLSELFGTGQRGARGRSGDPGAGTGERGASLLAGMAGGGAWRERLDDLMSGPGRRPDAPSDAAPRPAPREPADLRLIGEVRHYYDRLGVAVVRLARPLRTGAVIRVQGRDTSFDQRADSIEVDRQPVDEAPAGAKVGLWVVRPARRGDRVVTVPPGEQPLLHMRLPDEVFCGEVVRWFPDLGVAGIALDGSLAVGDHIRVEGRRTRVEQTVRSLHADRKPVQQAASREVGVALDQRVRRGDFVYRRIRDGE